MIRSVSIAFTQERVFITMSRTNIQSHFTQYMLDLSVKYYLHGIVSRMNRGMTPLTALCLSNFEKVRPLESHGEIITGEIKEQTSCKNKFTTATVQHMKNGVYEVKVVSEIIGKDKHYSDSCDHTFPGY